ncbi:hypothetical protein WDD9_006563 [Paenibacillus melissococcoides]|nr:hypothetical protein WDD9_006241 [Paenibacillus melissococcoides]CAH8721593.1 hypothetical protein WDD9_006370 [Paenibacillus melissococcoides]CAH8721985.1 hypothetical protein WDD9_006563 [Paenibacillus melissococcoides]
MKTWRSTAENKRHNWEEERPYGTVTRTQYNGVRRRKNACHSVKGGVKIFDGSFVAIDANGLAVPGAKATNLIAAGRAEEYIDNSLGADGDATIRVRRGVFKWNNAATGAVTAKDMLKSCYFVDDETVTATATGSSVAGKVIGIDGSYVVVETL